MKHLFFFLVLVSFFLTSCSSTKNLQKKEVLNLQKFSLSLMEEFNFPADSMKKLQFFSPDSIEIELNPVVKKENSFSVLKDGTLNLNTKNNFSLVIPTATPGILKEFTLSKETRKVDLIRIYFDEAESKKEEDKFLTFKALSDTSFVIVTKEYGGLPNVIKFGSEYYQIETKRKHVFLYVNKFGIEQKDFPRVPVKGKKIKQKS